jgi:hypothetical protein
VQGSEEHREEPVLVLPEVGTKMLFEMARKQRNFTILSKKL